MADPLNSVDNSNLLSISATNSSDDEAKETPKASSGAGSGNGPVNAAKNKKQKVIQEKENRKGLKVKRHFIPS